MDRINPHRGQTLDEYLKEIGHYEEVNALARKKLAILKVRELLLGCCKKAIYSRLGKTTKQVTPKNYNRLLKKP